MELRMLSVTINPTICPPERSTTESEATGREQSKDPYPRRNLVRRIEAFSRGSDLCDVGENSAKQQRLVKSKGILRLRERLRARYAQDDNRNPDH